MSFGASAAVRFENHSGAGRPVVFWDQQAKTSQKPKPVNKSYKSKQQVYPLRKPGQPHVSPDLQSTQPADRVKLQMTNSKVSKKPEARRYGSKNRKVPETADTVVLTQKEFNAILDTIGQLALEAEQGVSRPAAKPLSHVAPGVSVDWSLQDAVQSTRQYDSLPSAKPLPPSPDIPYTRPYYTGEPSQTPAQAQQMLPTQTNQNIPAYSQTAHQTAAQTVLSQTASGNPLRASFEKSLSEVQREARGVPAAHLTKAEKKRLQWEQEKRENEKVTEWSPWGRPGAGAPVKDNEGNLLTDYKTRGMQQAPPSSMLQTAPAATQSNTHHNNTTPYHNSTTPYHNSTTPFHNRGDMNSTAPAAVTSGSVLPPAAIRSSLMLGDPEANENRYESAKQRERREWLAELEKQREEQKQRKLTEKNLKQEGETYDRWADHFTTYKPHAANSQQVQGVEPPVSYVNLESSIGRTNSAPVAPPVEQVSAQQDNSNRTNIRGQNVFIDPVTLKELDEKRRKHLEHQEFIRHQIEEKERLKQEEKQRQMREEQAEEQKLRAERDRLNNQMQHEREKLRNKEEAERQRLEGLRQAMEQAQEIAEREKHAKRILKLQKAGHDTSHLHANFQAKMTPRVGGVTSTTAVYTESAFHDETPHATYPLHQDMDHSSGGERVVTPTKYRQTPISESSSPRREYGIQTTEAPDWADPVSGSRLISRESTEIEYRGLIQEKKKVRVISAPRDQKYTTSRPVKSAPAVEKPDKKTSQEKPAKKKRPVKLNERPSWGVAKPRKAAVKQSERDPFYEERLHKRELVKTLRQQEMLAMAEKNCPKVSKVPTSSSRARSRSRSKERDDWTIRPASQSPPRVDPGQGRTSRQSASPAAPTNPRPASPPIPAIKHRNTSISENHGYQYSESANTRMHHYNAPHENPGSRASNPSQHNKYQDQAPVQAPVKNNDFVPFIRSSNVLDPAHAESPMPLSREPSVMERARRAYIQENNPAKFGYMMDNYKDDRFKDNIPAQSQGKPHRNADPITNPGLVKDHPTVRQTQILQHLSDLRRGLMQKQRELDMEIITVE